MARSPLHLSSGRAVPHGHTISESDTLLRVILIECVACAAPVKQPLASCQLIQDHADTALLLHPERRG